MDYATDASQLASNVFRAFSHTQSWGSLGVQSLLLSILAHLLWKFYARRRNNPHNLPFPPGPKPLPLLGNIFDFPREKEAVAYLQMAKRYGNLFFLQALGKNILIVNDFKTATDLFEKRSANYSDRHESPMINGLMGWEWSFGHMRYGELWRNHRKMFHSQFQQSVAPIYWSAQLKSAHELLRHILEKPDDLINHLRHNAANTIMRIVYGIAVSPQDDKYISVAEIALDGMAKAASPGAFLVEFIEILKYIPAWLPGASFQVKARYWKKAVMEMRDAPFKTVLEDMKAGTASSSFVTNLVTGLEIKGSEEEEMKQIRNCAGLAYAAGAESSVASLTSFFLAMVLYPEVQEKAREELDRVIGRGRLPDFTDRDSLPYIDAVAREVLRWNPVAPLGLPHMSTEDDIYMGYFIPANTLIMGNTWAMLHDPEIFPDPMKFNPERFLGKPNDQHLSPSNPLSAAFGYGRRICPGRFMAEAQIWISVACILAVYRIAPGKDEHGNPVKVEARFSDGMICHPLKFSYSITPCNENAKALIEQTQLMDA